MKLVDSVNFEELQDILLDAAKLSISALSYELSKETLNLTTTQISTLVNDINDYVTDLRDLEKASKNTNLLTLQLKGLYKLDVLPLDKED